MPSYIAVIHKEPESSFGVSFPDFPGCITAGYTLDEAFRRAQEILPFHIKGLIEDGEEIPEPRSLDAVLADPEFAEGVPMMVPVAPISRKAIRVNITLEEGLLSRVDAYAKAHGKTRSGLIAEAVESTMLQAR